MIVFIIPFISKKASKDWNLASQLLQGTLDSLANQSESDYRAIVCCHEIPEIKFKGDEKHLEFLQMDYSPSDDFFVGKPRRDRWWKCCAGLRSLSGHDFRYCMAIDADDRIHQNMTAFLNQQTGIDAWVVNKGYQVDYTSSRLMKCKNLSQICGSTVILSPQAARVPKPEIPYDLIECFWCAASHDGVEEYCETNNFTLQQLPFHGLQYILNHSLNESNRFRGDFKSAFKNFLKFSVLGSAMPEEIKRDFGYLI